MPELTTSPDHARDDTRTDADLDAVPRRPSAFDELDRCHDDTLRMLAEFDALVTRLERGGVDPHARTMAAAIERHFSVAVRQHHADEERHVFPVFLAAGDAPSRDLVARLKQDHAWMDTNWRELCPMVSAIASGQSWFDLDVLREGVEVMSTLEREHIDLEATLIYPRARQAMREDQRERMLNAALARRRSEHVRLLRAERGS